MSQLSLRIDFAGVVLLLQMYDFGFSFHHLDLVIFIRYLSNERLFSGLVVRGGDCIRVAQIEAESWILD